MEHLPDMEHPLDMADHLDTVDPLDMVDPLDTVDPPDIVDHLQVMVVLPGMVHQDKEGIPPMATKEDLEVTLNLLVVTHHTGPLEDLVVLWVLPRQVATLHTIKIAMVHLHQEVPGVPPLHRNVCLHVACVPLCV